MEGIPTLLSSAALRRSGALEPDARIAAGWIDAAKRFIVSFDAEPDGADVPVEVISRLMVPPQDGPGHFDSLLAAFGDAARHGDDTANQVPGNGLLSAAVAELVARSVNRYTGAAAGLAAMERGLVRWLCSELGMPAGSGGMITAGTPGGTLTALVAARQERLGEEFGDGIVYLTDQTGDAVRRAARIAGVRPDNVRIVPTTPDLRMDPRAAAELVEADREAGRRPFLLVATAGTASTGAVDPLVELAMLARREDLWLHVDAGRGGFFQLTRRGRERLAGIASADSVTLDPHTGLFLSSGTGILLVRDPAPPRDLDDSDPLRALRLWLPLHLHGVAAFRAALDDKLDLAEHAHDQLHRMSGIHVPWRPQLSTVAFRDVAGNQATQRLLDRIDAAGEIPLSGTRVHGQTLLRLCVLGRRTGRRQVDHTLAAIRAASAEAVPLTG